MPEKLFEDSKQDMHSCITCVHVRSSAYSYFLFSFVFLFLQNHGLFLEIFVLFKLMHVLEEIYCYSQNEFFMHSKEVLNKVCLEHFGPLLPFFFSRRRPLRPRQQWRRQQQATANSSCGSKQ